jgi:hypothetical protein
LRENFLSLSGFPQIDVSDAPDDSFTVVLRWNKISSTPFHLSKAEASAAVKKFRSRAGYDPAIFNRVQKALADLEGKASRYPAVS